MNCDDFLEAFESMDSQQHEAARRHAEQCPACAALAEVHARLQRELAPVEPLPPRLRAVWESASSPTRSASEGPTLARRASEGVTSGTRHWPLQLIALAAAILLLITISALIWQNVTQPGGNPIVEKDIPPKDNLVQPAPTPPVLPKSIDASEELDKLLAQVSALEAELKKTSSQADLLDARHQASALLATYSQW